MGERLREVKRPGQGRRLCRRGRRLSKCGCGQTGCPFYWRAENCYIPNCYIFVCSATICAGNGPVEDGTVFEYQGQCYRVQAAQRWLKNPGDDTPPPDGFKYIPNGMVVDESKQVVCKESCGDCDPGDCTGPDCQLVGHAGNSNALGSACDKSWSFQCCFGKGTTFPFQGVMITRQPNRVNQWEWSGVGEGSPWPSIRAMVTLRYRRWFNGNLVIDETTQFEHVFGGTDWASAPVFGSPYGESTNWNTSCSISIGCGGSSYSGFTLGNGGVKIDEGAVSLTVVPGDTKCGPICPSEIIDIDSDLPGENPPGNPGNPGAVNEGGGCGGCGHDGGAGLGEAL